MRRATVRVLSANGAPPLRSAVLLRGGVSSGQLCGRRHREYSVAANLRDIVAEGLFSDTQKELKEAVQQFAQREIAPLAAETDRRNEFPMVPTTATPINFRARISSSSSLKNAAFRLGFLISRFSRSTCGASWVSNPSWASPPHVRSLPLFVPPPRAWLTARFGHSLSQLNTVAWAWGTRSTASPWRRSLAHPARLLSATAPTPTSASIRSPATAMRPRRRSISQRWCQSFLPSSCPLYGTDFLPFQLILGEHVGALAMSEPGSGSDVVSMKLRADKKGNKWCVPLHLFRLPPKAEHPDDPSMPIETGCSMVTSFGSPTDPMPTCSSFTPRQMQTPVPRGSLPSLSRKVRSASSAFSSCGFDQSPFVALGFPGFSTAQKLDKLGMRGSNTCEVNTISVHLAGSNAFLISLFLPLSLFSWSLRIAKFPRKTYSGKSARASTC